MNANVLARQLQQFGLSHDVEIRLDNIQSDELRALQDAIGCRIPACCLALHLRIRGESVEDKLLQCCRELPAEQPRMIVAIVRIGPVAPTWSSARLNIDLR